MPDIIVSFFLLGLVAGLVRSNLTLPRATYDTLSLLLMLTIGLKGGMALHGNIGWRVLIELGAVAALGGAIALLLVPVLRRLVGLSSADSASFAAHYGSVSAGTFAVALAWVESRGLLVGPEVTLYLVAMELPAIIAGIAIYRALGPSRKDASEIPSIWHETLTNRGVILLAGGVVIGTLYGPVVGSEVTALFTGAFTAVLALFLLEMGLTAAETLRPLPLRHWRVLVFALVAPPVLAMFGLGVAWLLGLPAGSTVILMTITASASYIAAPAAIRAAVPDANIGLAMLAALGLTFPLNVLIGLPLYHALARAITGQG